MDWKTLKEVAGTLILVAIVATVVHLAAYMARDALGEGLALSVFLTVLVILVVLAVQIRKGD